MLNLIVKKCRDELPPFNDYLLRDFRKEQVESIPQYLDSLFKESMRLIKDTDELKYVGYRMLSPEERVKYKLESFNKVTQMRDFNWTLYEYQFVLFGKEYNARVYVPYMEDGMFVMRGTTYCPRFGIVEKIVNHTTDGIIIKVMRTPLTFWRRDKIRTKSVNGEKFNDYIITVRAYHGNTKRKVSNPPLIIYNLAHAGFEKTCESFGFEKDELQFVPVEEVDSKSSVYHYFKSTDEIYLKLKPEVMKDVNKRRFVISLLHVLKKHKRYTIDDLYDMNSGYFLVNLGMWLSGKGTNEAIAVQQAQKHLESTDEFLDAVTRKDLESIGLHCETIYDLFRIVFFSISGWISDYVPGSLYNKKLNMLDHLLSDFVNIVFSKIYMVMRRKNKGNMLLNLANVLSRLPARRVAKVYDNTLFDASPSNYNGNILLCGGLRKMRTLTSTRGRGKSSNAKPQKQELVFHPSSLYVESLMSIPATNPGIGGSINAQLQITPEGHFIFPDRVVEALKVFDE